MGFFDVAARLRAGDGPIAELVGTARSFLCCDERIQVTFPSSILSDYVHIKARCVLIVLVLRVRNCLVQQYSLHPSLITLQFARDDPGGGRRPGQIPQLDTPQASKESHNSIHNPYGSMGDSIGILVAFSAYSACGERQVTPPADRISSGPGNLAQANPSRSCLPSYFCILYCNGLRLSTCH